jgi:hypothetical protein
MTDLVTSPQVQIHSMAWNRLDHIADVQPIGDSDAACLAEVRDVLEKHGALSRFGIALLHSHFDLADDEMLLETTDLDKREHLVRPVSRSWLESEGIQAQTTIVGFDESGFHQNCGCNPRSTGHHHL